MNKFNKYKNQYEKDQQTIVFLINYVEKLHKIIQLIKIKLNVYVKIFEGNFEDKKYESV